MVRKLIYQVPKEQVKQFCIVHMARVEGQKKRQSAPWMCPQNDLTRFIRTWFADRIDAMFQSHLAVSNAPCLHCCHLLIFSHQEIL